MQFSKATDYGLILLTSLAKNPGGAVSLRKLADRKNLPYQFLSRIAVGLTKAGYLRSREGIGGGYLLNKDPREIRLSEIIDLLEGTTALTSCSAGANCRLFDSCSVRKPLNVLEKKVNQVFDALTISDLM